MNEPRIRLARRMDLASLPAIEDSGAETFARAGVPLADGSPPAPHEQWAKAVAAGALWVVEDDGGVFGFLAGEVIDGGLHILEIDVIIERQQRGHGRRLMQHAIDWARGRGLAAATLTTFRGVRFNGPFYASLGFMELAPEATPAWLAEILAEEAAAGFEDRCAMRLVL
ncbi:MAG: GNAT family N-acetyltransferase [Caulobacterales bacterium]